MRVVSAVPGTAGQGEAVGKPQRQQGSVKGEHLMEGAPNLGTACKIPERTMQAVLGPGTFVAQIRMALA